MGLIICYDFWFNPELTRLLALKGARVIVNCCATFSGPGKRDYMVHTTSTRAQENLCYVLSSNHVGGPDAAVFLWVRQSEADGPLDQELEAAVRNWMKEAGPFERVVYPGRGN